MTSRTIVDSVPKVTDKPTDLGLIERDLLALRQRFPGAIVERYLEHVPEVAEQAFVAPGAALVGRVRLGRAVSVWFGCVLRGDINRIEIGNQSNIQDGTIVHLGDNDPTWIGEEVVVGHRVVLHGCAVEGGALIGIGAILLDGVRVGEGSVIGSGAVVTAGTQIPARSLVLGVPAKVVKTLSGEDEVFHRALAQKYMRLSHNYQVG